MLSSNVVIQLKHFYC